MQIDKVSSFEKERISSVLRITLRMPGIYQESSTAKIARTLTVTVCAGEMRVDQFSAGKYIQIAVTSPHCRPLVEALLQIGRYGKISGQ